MSYDEHLIGAELPGQSRGDIDFIPTEEYSQADALRAIEDARFVVGVAQSVVPLA